MMTNTQAYTHMASPRIQVPPTSGLAITGFILAFFFPFLGFWFAVFSQADIRNGNRTGARIMSWAIILNTLFLLAQIVLIGWLMYTGVVSTLGILSGLGGGGAGGTIEPWPMPAPMPAPAG